MTDNPIQFAYIAHTYVPVQKYRQGMRKKMDNPVVRAPALVQAMQHLGREKLPLADVRRRALQAVTEPQAAAYIARLEWDGLQIFLSTVALFLKAGGHLKRGQKGMRNFSEGETISLSAEERAQTALRMARLMKDSSEKVNRNKMQRLSAQIAGAADKWAALTSLARFYPLKGVPDAAIDELVSLLEQVDLYTFKEVMAQSLVFFEASEKGWEGLSS